MVTRDEIREAYRALLGREPESEDVYQYHSAHEHYNDLRLSLITSTEGVSRLRRDIYRSIESVPFNYFRPMTVFIHIPKTGGTSLHEWLLSCLPGCTASDPHTEYLSNYSMAELNSFDLMSGHFTFQEAMALPRSEKRLISCLREPYSRLVSMYRFFRAHPKNGVSSELMELAQNLSIYDYFSNDYVRHALEVNNRYLSVFSEGAMTGHSRTSSASELLPMAIANVAKLDAIAFTDSLSVSARAIAKQFGWTSFEDVPIRNRTDSLHRYEDDFSSVSRIDLNVYLKRIMYPLVEYDLAIFAFAKSKSY